MDVKLAGLCGAAPLVAQFKHRLTFPVYLDLAERAQLLAKWAAAGTVSPFAIHLQPSSYRTEDVSARLGNPSQSGATVAERVPTSGIVGFDRHILTGRAGGPQSGRSNRRRLGSPARAF